MGVLDTVKEHPYISGGVALGAIVVILIVMNSGGDTVTAAPPSSSVQVGSGMQAANQQAAFDAQNTALTIQTSAALQALTLTEATKRYGIEASADVATLQINRGADTDQLNSSLAAAIQGKTLDTQREVALASYAHDTDIAQINAAAQKNISDTLASVVTSQTAAQLESQRIAAVTQNQRDVIAAGMQQVQLNNDNAQLMQILTNRTALASAGPNYGYKL